MLLGQGCGDACRIPRVPVPERAMSASRRCEGVRKKRGKTSHPLLAQSVMFPGSCGHCKDFVRIVSLLGRRLLRWTGGGGQQWAVSRQMA